MMEEPSSIFVPDDVWREIFRNVIDYRTCLLISSASKKFKKIIQNHLKVVEQNKDLGCVLMGPPTSGKTSLLAQLGLQYGRFQLNGRSVIEALRAYAKDHPQNRIFIRCSVVLEYKVQRQAHIHDFVSKIKLGFVFRKSHADVVIFVVSFKQAVDDASQDLHSALKKMRLNLLSKILIVISHPDDDIVQEYYDNICREYTEVYEEYQQHWPQLQMKIVPVNAVTGWNIMPHATEPQKTYKGLSFYETLQKFHADGYPIHCPWRIVSVDDPMKNTFDATLVAGELKVRDLLINSEVKREIEEISLKTAYDEVVVERAYAHSHLKLKLKGPVKEPFERPHLYGPGVRSTSKIIARVIFLQYSDLPFPEKEFSLECCSARRPIRKFEVLKRFNPITYEEEEIAYEHKELNSQREFDAISSESAIDLEAKTAFPEKENVQQDNEAHKALEEANEEQKSDDSNYVLEDDAFIVSIELTSPICCELISSPYPDLSKISIAPTATPSQIFAIGVIVSAEWNK